MDENITFQQWSMRPMILITGTQKSCEDTMLPDAFIAEPKASFSRSVMNIAERRARQSEMENELRGQLF